MAVDSNENMVRAIARPAEAERERRAKAMQLCYLQTLTSIANERASTLAFPIAVDLINGSGNARQP